MDMRLYSDQVFDNGLPPDATPALTPKSGASALHLMPCSCILTICNDLTICNFNDCYLSPDGLLSGNKRWYG